MTGHASKKQGKDNGPSETTAIDIDDEEVEYPI